MKRMATIAAILAAVATTLLAGSTAAAPQARQASTGVLAAPDFDLPAVQLRIALDRALAEHAFLIIETMRTSVDETDDFDAAVASIEENTGEILDLAGSVYSASEADAFAEQWRNHIAYLVDYARASAAGDDDAQDLAESQLHEYTEEFTSLLVELNPGLPPDVVAGLVGEHVEQLEQIGRLTEGDYAGAYGSIRETAAHMFKIGDGLTLGILGRFENEFPGRETAFSPSLDLRLTLDRLLGEHTYLAAVAMRALLDDAEHVAAAVEVLGLNSAELATEVGKIYGDDAGDAFERLWNRHTTLYADYVTATSDEDKEAQEAALDGLAVYRTDFSSFLAGANPALDGAAFERLLEVHTEHLVNQVSVYAAGDYDAAYRMLREAYAHTDELAAGLAGAITDQFPQLFPDTSLPRRDLPVGVVGWLLISASALLLLRRRWGASVR